MGDLPPKLFFRIGEVAGLVGVEPHVLRYWEREFRSIRPTKSAKGQRVYSRKDVENLLRVRDLLYRDGFTIAGAKKRLHSPVALAPEPPDTDQDLDDGEGDASEPNDDTAARGAASTAMQTRFEPARAEMGDPSGTAKAAAKPLPSSGVLLGGGVSGPQVLTVKALDLAARAKSGEHHVTARNESSEQNLVTQNASISEGLTGDGSSTTREKLLALRDEVESFLDELSRR